MPAVRVAVEKALDEAHARPNEALANGRLGMVLHAHDRFAGARASYLRAAALDPAAFAWPYYLASVESSLGNYEAAQQAIATAARIDPSYLPALVKRGEILLDQGKLEESERLFAEAVAKDNRSAMAWYGQGRVQAALSKPADAIESLRKAVELYPPFGPAHYALAQSLRKLGREAEAGPHLAAYESNKTSFPYAGDRVMAEVLALNISAANFIRQGADLDAQGRLADAIALHQRALEADAKSAQAHANLISLYARAGDAVRAEASYKAGLALNPNLAAVHYNFGVLSFGQNRIAEARAAFERTLASNAFHAEAHNNLGYILESQGRAADAVKHYRKAIESQPGHRLASFHLACNLTLQRQYAEAIELLQRILKPEDNDTPGFEYALGVAYGRSGDTARAVETMRRARAKAAAHAQAELVASIDRDLQRLGAR